MRGPASPTQKMRPAGLFMTSHPACAALSPPTPALLGFCSRVWGLFGSSSPRLGGRAAQLCGVGVATQGQLLWTLSSRASSPAQAPHCCVHQGLWQGLQVSTHLGMVISAISTSLDGPRLLGPHSLVEVLKPTSITQLVSVGPLLSMYPKELKARV